MDVRFSNLEKIDILEAAGYVVLPAAIVVEWRCGNVKGLDELYGYRVEDQFGQEFCRPERSGYATEWLDKAFEACLRKMLSVAELHRSYQKQLKEQREEIYDLCRKVDSLEADIAAYEAEKEVGE